MSGSVVVTSRRTTVVFPPSVDIFQDETAFSFSNACRALSKAVGNPATGILPVYRNFWCSNRALKKSVLLEEKKKKKKKREKRRRDLPANVTEKQESSRLNKNMSPRNGYSGLICSPT